MYNKNCPITNLLCCAKKLFRSPDITFDISLNYLYSGTLINFHPIFSFYTVRLNRQQWDQKCLKPFIEHAKYIGLTWSLLTNSEIKIDRLLILAPKPKNMVMVLFLKYAFFNYSETDSSWCFHNSMIALRRRKLFRWTEILFKRTKNIRVGQISLYSMTGFGGLWFSSYIQLYI